MTLPMVMPKVGTITSALHYTAIIGGMHNTTVLEVERHRQGVAFIVLSEGVEKSRNKRRSSARINIYFYYIAGMGDIEQKN